MISIIGEWHYNISQWVRGDISPRPQASLSPNIMQEEKKNSWTCIILGEGERGCMYRASDNVIH